MNTGLVSALLQTGEFLEKYCRHADTGRPGWKNRLDDALGSTSTANPWFIRDFVLSSLYAISRMLREEELLPWFKAYPELDRQSERPLTVGVISAGNIPLVGFHDFLCVMVSGNKYAGKLSSKDNILLPVIAGFITELYPEAAEKIHFGQDRLSGFDAVIATGSNNTFRYFEYYFRKYPSILRKNRNSVAVLGGGETPQELQLLGDDIFLYFGLGCRNVSKIYIPADYDITVLFPHWLRYSFMEDHNKYHNNYSYYKSIFLVNREEHLDNGYLLVKEDAENLVSPLSVLYIERYQSLEPLRQKLELYASQIQCVVGRPDVYPGAVPFGNAQFPGVNDYADGVDVMRFLLDLKEIN